MITPANGFCSLAERQDFVKFLALIHVTFALTTVAIHHVGYQTNALNREITVRTKA